MCVDVGGVSSCVVEDLPAYESDGQEDDDNNVGNGVKNSMHEEDDDDEVNGTSNRGSYWSVNSNKPKATAALPTGAVTRATRITLAAKASSNNSKRGERNKTSNNDKPNNSIGGLPIVNARSQRGQKATGGTKERGQAKRLNEPILGLLMQCGQGNQISERDGVAGGGGEAMILDNNNNGKRRYTKKTHTPTSTAAEAMMTDTSMLAVHDDQHVNPSLTVPSFLSDGLNLQPHPDGTLPGGLPVRQPMNAKAAQKLRGQAAVVPRTGEH